jgi:light-independent protochlorophyllide reductase subunit B
MFRGDFEFHDGASASHLHAVSRPAAAAVPAAEPGPSQPAWTSEGEEELKKIPFFVRGKARRNTERFAAERGVRNITIETLYEAKAYFGR